MPPPLKPIPSLLQALEAVPDHRRAAGRRHALPAVLAFVCCGMLCGNRGLLAIAEWGRAHQGWCCQTFGFKRCTPCLNTLHRVLAGLDVVTFEAVLRTWISPQLEEPERFEPLAIDGKAVRGTKAGPHLPGAYLLSVYAGRRGAVLAQVAIGSRENELTQAIPVLQQVDLAGKLVTGDALFTQRAICEHILARGGHYLFEVKDNQATLLADVRRPFSNALHPLDSAQTVAHAHGRTEIRTVHLQAGLDGWSAWPGVGQVCRILHQVRRRGHWQVELHFKITSLSPEQASASDLLQLSRSHWSIENQLHYVRDVTLGEDASRIRTGAAPHAMAAIRNVVLTVLRLAGATNLASGLRHFGWDPEQAIMRLGWRSVPVRATHLMPAA